MDYHIEKVASAKAEVGEGPVWNPDEKKYIGLILPEEDYLNMTPKQDQMKLYTMEFL